MNETRNPAEVARHSQILGWHVVSNEVHTFAFRGRWRLWWFNPRIPESWTIEIIFGYAESWKLGIGPLQITYEWGDDY